MAMIGDSLQLPPALPGWRLPAFFGIALLFFARSYSSYFVCDDYFFLGRIDFEKAASYFTESWGYGNEYRPVLPYSYALDARLSGENPAGYHLTSTILHSANAILLGLLALRIGLPRNRAWLASFIYLLNPVAHESVLWISGRPVVLSAFFVLACCYVFVRAAQAGARGAWQWAGAYVFFVVGLGTYELAIVTPLLAALLCHGGGVPLTKYRKHLGVFLALAAVYGSLWMWFFEFRFTRIHIEHSFASIAANFGQALGHSFHGSFRWDIAPLYAVLFVMFWRTRYGRALTLAALAWFAAAYLPYFAVQGFADRFAYLSSAAAAVLLSSVLLEVSESSPRRQAIVVVIALAYFGTGMQNRITAWKEAGEIARTVTRDIKREVPDPAGDRLLVLLNVPAMHKRSYVYLTGLDRALAREYGVARIPFVTELRPSVDENAIILQYANGRMVRRTAAEVR